jgi:hypothetical protein
MLIGALNFCLVGAFTLSFDDMDKRHFIWLVYVFYGTGRAVWENTLKVVYIGLYIYSINKQREARESEMCHHTITLSLSLCIHTQFYSPCDLSFFVSVLFSTDTIVFFAHHI